MISSPGIMIDNFTMEDLPSDILKEFYRYWLSIKGDRTMPSRRNLNPADIVGLLPYINLIDVEHDSQRYKMRLVGTETVKALGRDITGKYLDEIPAMERHLKQRYEWIVKEKRPYMISDKLVWSPKSFLHFHALGMPLSNDGQTVNIIMYGSCFLFPDEI